MSVQICVSQQFCEEHSRVELQDGKCIACGEVEYLTQEQQDMGDKQRVKWLLFVYGLFFTVFAGIIYFTM